MRYQTLCVKHRRLELLSTILNRLERHQNQLHASYLTYIMNYIILVYICQEVFEIFIGDGKNRTCVSHLRTFPKGRPFCISANLIRIDHSISSPYPSCLLKKDVEVTKPFLVVRAYALLFNKRPRCFSNFQTMHNKP